MPVDRHLEWFPDWHPYKCRPFLPLLQLTCLTVGHARIRPLVAHYHLGMVFPSGTRIENTHTGCISQPWRRCCLLWILLGFPLAGQHPLPQGHSESFSHTLSSACPCPPLPRTPAPVDSLLFAGVSGPLGNQEAGATSSICNSLV